MDNFNYVTAADFYFVPFSMVILFFIGLVIYYIRTNKESIFTDLYLLIIIFCLLSVGWCTMFHISAKIADWADFSTCLTALFALISIYLAYRAFMGQVNASRRASFDATFTQIFAQHNTLRTRVISHSNSFWCKKNVFTRCKEEFTQKGNQTVWEFWDYFNERVIKNEVSVDFKNFFKYIYHEVTTVTDQKEKVLDDDTKKKYIDLIQAQMNNDELFCYLINQISHYHNVQSRNSTELNRARIYAGILQQYDFFKEISQYINLKRCLNVRDYSYYIEEMYYDNHTRRYIEMFINEKYLNRLSSQS